MSKKAEKKGELPILWNVDKGIATRHATNMVIQASPHEVLLSFFEALPPILIGSPAEVQEQLAKMPGLEAHCVARIVVAPGRLKEFVQILSQTVEQMESKKRKQ
jgi:hypothetical protein